MKISASEITHEEGSHDLVDGPDTSSFTAFLYSFLSSSDSRENANSHEQNDEQCAPDTNNNGSSPLPDSSQKENGERKSLFSRSKQSLGKAIRQATRIGGFRHQDRKDSNNNIEMKFNDEHGSKVFGAEMKRVEPMDGMPGISEASVLLSDSIRNVLYASLPPLMQGRKWMLLYRYLV